jgi:Ca2+-binding RTX toxin-like protein
VGLGGDDSIQVPASILNPTFFFGGGGNDKLKGGNGPNVLQGGSGNDKLTGGIGRDLLIGGTGIDKLSAKAGDDILIGAASDSDGDLSALQSVMAEWGRVEIDYITRYLRVLGTLTDGLNNGVFLNATTIHDDAAIDTMVGSGNADWFFALQAGAAADKPKDPKTGEVVTGL